jgi:hypothetical protein
VYPLQENRARGTKCWKKHPELILDKVRAARKKQAEKKSEKISAAATAIDEG